MKVIFEHLDKLTLVGLAYEILKNDEFERTHKNVKPLTHKEISFIRKAKEIDRINDIYLGVKFKGNYVEIDDELSCIYISLLYKMKTDSAYFSNKMKEDFIIEFEYKDYKEKVEKIGRAIEKVEKELYEIDNDLTQIKKYLNKNIKDDKRLNNLFNKLIEEKKIAINNINILLKERENTIIRIFELEGSPREEIEKTL